jgi:hypothetical protein
MSAKTPAEIAEVLRLHALHRAGDPAGKRANLTRANLSGANLSGANLSGADLSGANLTRANLSGANLSGAGLSGADLSWASLSGADLSWASLSGANLSWANLSWANLSWADLSRANLSGANLSWANLSWANLPGVKGSAMAFATTVITPAGDLLVWKKCRGELLARLLIPSAAARSNATGRKCRAEFAIVIGIETVGGEAHAGPARSLANGDFTYVVGETVRPDQWEPDRWQECAGGIHFFITREEAVAYTV